MNNNKIELTAVNRVEDAVISSNILEPYIDNNDKTPSWDGNIFVYESSDINKRNFKGKIPVQVKGTLVNEFSEMISFPFETSDLKNYLTDGGVLFFVVEIIDICNARIYYESLLPLDIKKLLSKAKDTQKTISAKLKPIDISNTKHLESICLEFLFHRERQYSTVKYTKTINDFNIINFALFPGDVAPNKYMLENDIYIYGKENKDSIPIPISKISVEAISSQVLKTISINSKIYFDDCSVTESKSGIFITIGNKLTFYPTTGILNFKLMGSLTQRLKEAQFLEDLVKNKHFFVGDIKVEGLDMSEEEGIQIHQYLKYLKDIDNVIKFFNIQEDLNIDSFNERDYTNLDMLIDIVLYNKKIKFKSAKTGVQHIKIGNVDIAALIIVNKNETISIYNYFSSIYKRIECTIRFDEDKKENIKGGFYSILKAHDIVESSNLDLTVVEEEVKSSIPNDVYAEYTTLLILELIKAYDINKKLITSLYTALRLCNWLEKYDNIFLANTINRLQIIKRLRALKKEEKQELN